MKNVRTEVEEAAPAAAKTTIKFHRLIYSVEPDQTMTPLASGLLLRVGPRRVLGTAAHVLGWNSDGSGHHRDLATYGRGGAVVLRGESFRTAIAAAGGKPREPPPGI
jgi:hypothetical protein